MLTLIPSEIRRLQGAGGVPFTAFMDLLIRVHTRRHGLTDQDVDTTIRTNLADGGVDTSVRRAVPRDETGWMGSVPTAWQYKGTDFANVKRNELLEGEAVKERIRAGYAFRLALADSPPDDKRRELESYLRAEAEKLNPNVPEPRVVGADDLAAWASRYPALILSFFRGGFGDTILHLEAWASNAKQATPEFRDVPEWAGTRRSLEEHVDLVREATRAVLPLQGEAGVGKSRLAFEVASSIPAARSLVIYCIGEDAARNVATELANGIETIAILIADECGAEARARLETLLTGHRARIRVVAIDNSGERAFGPLPEQLLGKMDPSTLRSILAGNFPNVPESRRHLYASLAEGFPRLAADLCMNDALIVPAGTTQPVIATIAEYLSGRRLSEDQQEALAALSLVTKIGYQAEVRHELDELCSIVELDRRRVERALRDIHDGPGFVARAGRYYYVTPEIVAQVALEDAWRRWGHDPSSLLDRVPENLIQPFLDRAWRSAPMEVRRDCADYFREWASTATPERLRDVETVRRLVALCDTMPEEFLQRVRRLIEAASVALLSEVQGHGLPDGSWGPRRSLVWLAERFAAFSEFFDDSERILLRLALAESEPGITNNATGIWRQLYRIQLSGTSIPFSERLQRLRRRLHSHDSAEAALAATALEGIFDYRGSRMIGPALVAGRVPPDEWRPRSRKEEAACYRAAVVTLADAAQISEDLRGAAVQIAIDQLRPLISRGLLPEVQQLFNSLELNDEQLAGLVESLDTALAYDFNEERSGRTSNSELLRDELKEWRSRLSARSLHTRLVATVGKDRWSPSRLRDHVRGGESSVELKDPFNVDLAELARAYLADPPELQRELKWLMSEKAKSAGEFGEAVGRADTGGSLIDLVVTAAVGAPSKSFARGYAFGVVAGNPANASALKKNLASLETTAPDTVAQLSVSFESPEESVARITRMFDAGSLTSVYLAAQNFRRGGDKGLSPQLWTELLERLAKAAEGGDLVAERVALDSLIGVVPYDPEKTEPSFLLEHPEIEKLTWRILETRPIGAAPGSRWWRPIVVALARLNPKRAAQLAAQLLAAEEIRVWEEGKAALAQIASINPEEAMAALGSAMLDDRTGWRFFISDAAELIAKLPNSVVIEWLKRTGVEGARRIARSLAGPYVDAAGSAVVPPLTEWVLREFESDDRTFREFCAGVHNFQVYSGDIAAQHEAEAEVARRFHDYPLRRIREWAEYEERNSLAEAELTRRWSAESDLP